ncbi:MAG: carboxynorspermidine decarboxylase [Alphaproteobacteria bacterium]|nr:carboxynorspermidine decarboxylase [Alphaproteobacteria bacterium]
MTHRSIPAGIATPAYVVDVAKLKANLAAADRIRKEAGAKVLLATKAFAMPAAFPFMAPFLDGTTASGGYEAKLAAETFAPGDASKEVHVYSPAYTSDEMTGLKGVASHVYFNSARQLAKYRAQAKQQGQSIGLRINPGYSNATLGGALYDPCAPNSRFGEVASELEGIDWSGVHTLHAHALCESKADGSVGLIEHIATHFGEYVRKVKAVNFGGGHFLNKPGYDVDKLISALKAFKATFGVETYIEPGGGLVVDAGYLVSTVVDLHRNGAHLAIMDASASCHMPDVLEVPYRPEIAGAGQPGEKAHTYILGGKTCMTGDVIGEYSFDEPLQPGDRVTFLDMAQYSFVKNTTFNGAPLPDLALLHEEGRYEVVRAFGYRDFAGKLS